jgi:hypothetical protein
MHAYFTKFSLAKLLSDTKVAHRRYMIFGVQWAAESLTIITCTPEDGQLGRNMFCPIKEYKERKWKKLHIDGTKAPKK